MGSFSRDCNMVAYSSTEMDELEIRSVPDRF